MAATDARHSRTHPIDPPWTIRVSLLPGELFSSWLVRTALAQGCDPLVLTGQLWPRWRAWTRDLDRSLPEDRLEAISQRSGTSADAIQANMLRNVTPAISPQALDDRATWPWILTLGSRNRRRLAGLQYCPLCLRSDLRPYYRLMWRLAWHVGCQQHACPLLDRCPHCVAPVEPHRSLAADNDLALCASCKHDLRDAEIGALDPEALKFQEAGDLASAGRGQYGGKATPASEWFALARYFVGLVRKAAPGRLITLSAFLRLMGVDATRLSSPPSGLALEHLPIGDRAPLLGAAWRLLEAGPKQFLADAKASAISATALQDRRQGVPSRLAPIIDALPDVRIRVTTRREKKIYAPRPRAVVLRMCARLKRKMRASAHD